MRGRVCACVCVYLNSAATLRSLEVGTVSGISKASPFIDMHTGGGERGKATSEYGVAGKVFSMIEGQGVL